MQKRVFLDTETTGLGANDQVVQVAVVDENLKTLYSSYVSHEKTPMNPSAQRVHNIPTSVLASAPRWPQVWKDLRNVLDNATEIVAYNAEFDLDKLTQTAALYDQMFPPDIAAKFRCAMGTTRKHLGPPPNARYPNQNWSLRNALAHLQIDTANCPAHDAVGDAYALALLVSALRKHRKDM